MFAGIEESNESQSLMANLATVDEATWRSRLPGEDRWEWQIHAGVLPPARDGE